MNDAIVTSSNTQALLELHDANSLQRNVDCDERYSVDVCLLMGRNLSGQWRAMVTWFWCVGCGCGCGLSKGGGMGRIRCLVMVDG
jgi:hypothetical protein